jgi:hypothetical protein
MERTFHPIYTQIWELMYAITELLLKNNKKNPRRPANTGQSATAAGPIGSPLIVDQRKAALR